MAYEKAISLPFSVDTFGMIGTTTDQSKIWADKVRSVLGTSVRERVMRPAFGTLIPFSLFNGEESAVFEIKDEVSSAFASRLSLLNLTNVEVEPGSTSGDLSVTVTYSLPNQEVQETSIGFINIQGIFPPYEERL
jgi:phage baseplate assembly protein W